MAEPQTGLHVAISGDCSGLIAATNRSKSALDEFAGNSYTASIGLTGISESVRGANQVAAAAGQIPTSIPISVDSGQVAEARGQLTGLGADARATGRDLDSSFSGSRAFNFSDGGSVRQFAGDLSRAQEGYQRLGASAESGMSRADMATQDLSRSQSELSSSLGQVSAAHAGSSQSALQSAESMDRNTGAAQRQQAAFKSATAVMDSYGDSLGRAAGGQDVLARNAGADFGGSPVSSWTGGGPPIDDGGGGGGGGGGGSDALGGGGIFKEGGALDSGLKKLGMPALAGAAIGLVEALAPAAVGFAAMNDVVKDTPALAYASGKAMAQFSDGIREGAQGATAIGVPAFQKLGEALRPLGEEVGHIGAANMGQMLGAEASLAGGLTTALKSIEPTVGPAISAVQNLGNAFLQGISNPEVAKGIAATANALSTPGVASAVSSLTATIATVSPYLATGATQAVADVFGNGAGASNVDTGWKTQPVGETMAEHSGGLFAYDPATDAGLAGNAPLPGDQSGVSWNQNSWGGRLATAVGSTAHLAGLAGVDMLNASALTGSAAPELHAAADDQSARWGALTSGQGLGSPSLPASAQTLASSQAAAPLGYDRGPGGSLTPSASIGSGGGYYPGAPAGRTPADVPKVDPATGKPPPGGTSPTTDTRAPAPGSSGSMLTPQQVSSLNATLPSLSSNLSQTGSSAQQLSSGLQQTPQQTQRLQQGLQSVGQSAQQMSQPMSQASQHVQAATQAVQQLSTQAPQAVASIGQIAPAVNKSLGEAAPQIASAGAAMGAQIPTSMGQGIQQNSQEACAAANKMGNDAANCGKAALQTASPSKIFVTIGQSIPDGLALGVANSTPAALSAVSAAMNQVVAAGQAGLQTASPSKTFQTMGQQAMQQTANGLTSGANSYVSGSNARYSMLNNMAKDAEEQQRELEKANDPLLKSDQSYQKYLDRMGYDKSTEDRLMQRHQDDEKKQQNKPESERQKLNQAAFDRTKANQLSAMEKAGIQGLSNDPAKDGGLSPMGQYKAMEKAKSDAAKALGIDAVRAGTTPQQLLNSRQNATLGAGPDTGGAGQGGFGDPNKGFGKTGVGQNSSGYEQGKGQGSDGAKGFKDGMDGGKGGAADAGGDAGQAAVDAAKRKTGVRSPSTVFFGIGNDLMSGLSNGVVAGGPSVTASIGDTMSGALGAGVTAASNGVMGIASNTGLAVGYQWGESVVTGAFSVLKTADFQQISLPQIGTPAATTALGQLGLLGPAGSGGSIPNNTAITMAGGSPAQQAPQQLTVNVLLDGQPFDQKVINTVTSAMNQLADSIPQQVG